MTTIKYKNYFIQNKDKKLGFSGLEKNGEKWMFSCSSMKEAKRIIDSILINSKL